MPDPMQAGDHASAQIEEDIDFAFDYMGDSFHEEMANAIQQQQPLYVQVSAPVCNNKRGPDIARWTEEVLNLDLKGLRHYIESHNLSAADTAELKAARRRQQNYLNWKASAERKKAAKLAQGISRDSPLPSNRSRRTAAAARETGTAELLAEVASLRAQLTNAHSKIAQLESMLTKTA